MIVAYRSTTGQGDAAIYMRLRRSDGAFYNFVAGTWVTPQVDNCRAFLTEYADSDPTNSMYADDVVIPPNGPYAREIVLDATGAVLSFDLTDRLGPLVLPTLAGTVTQSYALSSQAVDMVRGDSNRLTFNIGSDLTGWVPWFAIRRKYSGIYTVAAKQATWVDETLGTGYVDVSAAENVVVGELEAEIELRNGTERSTPLKFDITVIDDIVKG